MIPNIHNPVYNAIHILFFISNATGVIPVAKAMLGKGVALGTILAFMMSIAALSLPELMILRKVIRWLALALFAGVLAVAIALIGWGFNLIA